MLIEHSIKLKLIGKGVRLKRGKKNGEGTGIKNERSLISVVHVVETQVVAIKDIVSTQQIDSIPIQATKIKEVKIKTKAKKSLSSIRISKVIPNEVEDKINIVEKKESLQMIVIPKTNLGSFRIP